MVLAKCWGLLKMVGNRLVYGRGYVGVGVIVVVLNFHWRHSLDRRRDETWTRLSVLNMSNALTDIV